MNAAKSKRVRLLWSVVRIVAGVYLGVAIVMGLLQERFIFPGAATQGRPQSVVRPAADRQIVNFPAVTGERIAAMFGPALTPLGDVRPDAASRPTIIFFYGNGMCMADTADQFAAFRHLGFNVLVPEYLGYGMSDGKPGEKSVYATADAAWNHLAGRSDVDARRIVPVGWSLGGAAALHLAATRPAAGVAVFSTFTNMNELARRALPFFPTSLLLRHCFDNEAKIARVTCPILIGHGRRDGLVPFDMSGRLAAAAKQARVQTLVFDSNHNDWFDVGGSDLLHALQAFIEGLP